ncbi:hypothetical protein M514_01175 [Trichuris suis]|uniref:Uncharacterized protein n=1 Tax=Trichuris suis TaxID=68888 RepID=A0A085NN28_9BILA|nr:hypothetical protein M513_01175 [Trichuris suis]KFD70874.1 hypothetical protein M514_01175 [Trichuris suis]
MNWWNDSQWVNRAGWTIEPRAHTTPSKRQNSDLEDVTVPVEGLLKRLGVQSPCFAFHICSREINSTSADRKCMKS